MKSVGFGFEAAANGQLAQFTIPIVKPITIVGVQMSVSFCLTQATGFFENTHSQVLSYVLGPPRGVSAEIGNPTNGATLGDGTLAALILKSWLTAPTQTGQYSGNVTNMGLEMPVSAGEHITVQMAHDGNAGAMEMQGILFYKPGIS